jgi:hypothetical protein
MKFLKNYIGHRKYVLLQEQGAAQEEGGMPEKSKAGRTLPQEKPQTQDQKTQEKPQTQAQKTQEKPQEKVEIREMPEWFKKGYYARGKDGFALDKADMGFCWEIVSAFEQFRKSEFESVKQLQEFLWKQITTIECKDMAKDDEGKDREGTYLIDVLNALRESKGKKPFDANSDPDRLRFTDNLFGLQTYMVLNYVACSMEEQLNLEEEAKKKAEEEAKKLKEKEEEMRKKAQGSGEEGEEFESEENYNKAINEFKEKCVVAKEVLDKHKLSPRKIGSAKNKNTMIRAKEEGSWIANLGTRRGALGIKEEGDILIQFNPKGNINDVKITRRYDNQAMEDKALGKDGAKKEATYTKIKEELKKVVGADVQFAPNEQKPEYYVTIVDLGTGKINKVIDVLDKY